LGIEDSGFEDASTIYWGAEADEADWDKLETDYP